MTALQYHRPGLRIDLICECLDNFGDAGISWRLAKLLDSEWQARVRLYIDKPSLVQLWAERDRAKLKPGQHGPEVINLSHLTNHLPSPTADLVIAMLGSTVPPVLRATLATGGPAWIRYEYLTAESWADEFHLLPSIKPADGAQEWFFYPGFSTQSGGLLRDRGLVSELNDFSASDPNSTARRNDWLHANGLTSDAGHWRICLFGYPDESTRNFLAALEMARLPTTVFMSDSLAKGLALTQYRLTDPSELHVVVHPWLDQPGFDRLLASCDLNIVRGEDSWLRAQWAGQPMLWQPYRQPDDGHMDKLDAYLHRLLDGAEPTLSNAVTQLMRAVNGATEPSAALSNWLEHREAITRWHLDWRDRLAAQSSLTDRLAKFCRDQLQLPA